MGCFPLVNKTTTLKIKCPTTQLIPYLIKKQGYKYTLYFFISQYFLGFLKKYIFRHSKAHH